MKILIIGGGGYIGSALVPRLLERGYEVAVADLFWFGQHLPKEVPTLRLDANTMKEEDLKGYEQVIFLAGLSNDPMAEFSPALNFQENGATPAYMAWIAKRAGVQRFIYGGTCSVYGYTVNELYNEDQPTRSSYPYGISKLIGEYGALQQQAEDFSVICFRQGTVSGYSPRMRFDLIVNTMFKTAIMDGVIKVNNPAIWRPILSIRDAVTAYIRAVEAPYAISGVFNVASGNYTVGEVADLVNEGVRKHLGREVKLNIMQMKDFRNYKVSFQKAMDVLSFKPQFDVEDIVRELSLRVNEFGDFSNPEYYNIATFKALEDKGQLTASPSMRRG